MNNTKTCSCCNVEKSLTEFHKYSKSKDGHKNICKHCRVESSKSYHYRNQATILQKSKAYRDQPHRKELSVVYQKVYREENSETLKINKKVWYEKTKERTKPQRSEYKKNNRAWFNQLNAERRAMHKSATALWGDKKVIREIYELAKMCSDTSGIPHHVDHIIPIKGKNVCGLHVENNLQILSATANISKGNRYVSL